MLYNGVIDLVHRCLKGRSYIFRCDAVTLDELRDIHSTQNDDCNWNKKDVGLLVLLDDGPQLTINDLVSKKLELETAEPLRLLRELRNRMLAETDYLANPDYPHATDDVRLQWLAYRQALRDLPSNSHPQLLPNGDLDLSSVIFPVKPL